ncbi:MAG TPA: zf-HC2 domain-containing protein [Ktedonobacterales bacterium]|jgi:anti-sigma factor RsiW
MSATPTNDAPLTCQELVELVTGYLDGSLAPQTRTRFEAHLSICRGCANYVEQMRQTIRVSGTLTTESIPDDVCDHLLETFRAWKHG